MMRRDVTSAGARAAKRRTQLSLVLGSLVVVGVSLAIRTAWGPDAASADPQPTRAATAVRPSSPATASVSDQAARPRAADAQPSAAREPAVMAVVNGEPISRQELAQECLRRYGHDVLESIINKQLIWQECQRRELLISEQDVHDEVERMAGKFGLSADGYLAMLHQERDISPQQYRRDVVWPALALRRLIADQVEVSANDLHQALESEYGPRVRVRLIAVTNRELAERLRERAVADPEQFGELAKTYSEDPHSASTRGVIPPIRKHMGNPEVERVAFGLQRGEISPLIPLGNQYLILKCEQQLSATFVSNELRRDAESRLREKLREDQIREQAPRLLERLQDEAQVVNVFNDPQLRSQWPGVAAKINGQPVTIQQLADECLLRFGGEVLDGEINRRLLQQELTRRGLKIDQHEIDEEIARAADAYGYLHSDGSPDVDAWLQAVTEQDGATEELYVRDAVWPSVALKKLVGDRVEITEEDLQKGFESNYGVRVEVLAIVVGNQRIAQQVWEMARDNSSTQFFGELASQYSIEPVSRGNLGRVPPIRRYGGQPAVEREAFRLRPGELSGIVAVGDKHIILKCLGRTQPVVDQLSDVRDELYKHLREQKLRLAMTNEFDRLRQQSQIDNYLAGTVSQVRAASHGTAAR